MKTRYWLVAFLPRFRWFVWGFGLCAIMMELISGYLSLGGPIMLLFGVMTYPPEWTNAKLIEIAKAPTLPK